MERKRLQQLQKKEENKALLEKEMSSIKVGGKQPIAKVTRAEIVSATEKRNQIACKKKEEETPIEENLNRIVLEGETAHGVDEAISVLRYFIKKNFIIFKFEFYFTFLSIKSYTIMRHWLILFFFFLFLVWKTQK